MKQEFSSSDTSLNPWYTFDNFVVDDRNRFAAEMAKAVAQASGNSFSPLFIYGKTGVGKTHLMHAIGLYIMEHFPKLSVLYVSAEKFTDVFFNAAIHKKMKAFRGRYQNADVLLIDDIQCISEKTKTVEEVFNTFEALYNTGKLMVFASTLLPKEILGIDERLRSRLGMGMLVEIKPPSYKVKVAILKNKAAHDKVQESDGLSEAIAFIAEHINNNVQALESDFNRVVFYAKITDTPITKALAEEVLKDEIYLTRSLSGEYDKVVEKFMQANPNIVIVEPKGFDECPKLADTLKRGMPVIINLENVENDTARKIFAFLSGVAYGLNGNVQKLAQNIFTFLPENNDEGLDEEE